jgi:hypothetical protein
VARHVVVPKDLFVRAMDWVSRPCYGLHITDISFLTSFSVLKSIGSAETSDLSVNYLGNARKKQ